MVRACQDFLSSAVPKLVDAMAAKFQEVQAAQARTQQDAQKLEGKDAVKHAVMTNAKLSCTTTTDTGAYRNWILGRFRKKVKNLADVVNRAAEELAEVGLLNEIKDSRRKQGRKVQFYRKSPWEELTDAAKSEAERLQIPRSVFE